MAVVNLSFLKILKTIRLVLVSDPEIITEGKNQKQGNLQYDTEVLRRFSDFEWLYNQLVNKYGGFLVPLLPEKNILTKFNKETMNFSNDRKKNLEYFLQKLINHSFLQQTEELQL
ncbi:sorting nexin 1, putative, partial [Ichthyophthirius multifiliis]